MITVTDLSKRFKHHQVLNHLTLSFPSGTVTAIIGPNGSGKTTLMKCILGLVAPDTGDISVDRLGLGYMAQIARYPENLTAREVIEMIAGLHPDRTPVSTQQLVERFGLQQHLEKPMRALSGGTRQKVGAVIAMMFGPTALLLDEPTAGLDPVASERLKDLISEIRNQGATILITSHILSEIQELADRVVYLHEGNVLYSGDVASLLEQTEAPTLSKAIAQMMGAPDEVAS